MTDKPQDKPQDEPYPGGSGPQPPGTPPTGPVKPPVNATKRAPDRQQGPAAASLAQGERPKGW
jgi:hypothetical protein